MERDEILRVLRAFEEAGLEYVLIGATAMGFHGIVRATQDLDLLIKATAENVERLRAALRHAYDSDPSIEDIATDDLLGDYPAVRYYPPTGDLYFDVLTRLGEAASYDSVESETKKIAGASVTVATPAALFEMKNDRAGAAVRVDGQGIATMPVQKFRSIEEMNRAVEPDGVSDFDRFLRHCARYWALAPQQYPRGVFKFRSVEDMRHPEPASDARSAEADA